MLEENKKKIIEFFIVNIRTKRLLEEHIRRPYQTTLSEEHIKMANIRRETVWVDGQHDGVRLDEFDKRLDARLVELEDDEELDVFAREIEKDVELEQLKRGTKRVREEDVEEDVWFTTLQRNLIRLEEAEELEKFAMEVERYVYYGI